MLRGTRGRYFTGAAAIPALGQGCWQQLMVRTLERSLEECSAPGGWAVPAVVDVAVCGRQLDIRRDLAQCASGCPDRPVCAEQPAARTGMGRRFRAPWHGAATVHGWRGHI
jgi:hypothetical protein